MNVAEVEHRSGGFRFALIVLAMAPGTAIPRIRALYDPAFAHGRESFGTFWPGLHLDSPARTILRQPLFERMVVIFGIAKDRLQPGERLGADLGQQIYRRYTVINLGARNHNRQQ